MSSLAFPPLSSVPGRPEFDDPVREYNEAIAALQDAVEDGDGERRASAERTLHDLRMDALRNHPLIDLHMRLLRDTIDLLLQPTEPTHLLPLERAEQELPVHREDSREQFHEHSLNT